MMKIDMTSGLTELADFCKRAAAATSRLASVRDHGRLDRTDASEGSLPIERTRAL